MGSLLIKDWQKDSHVQSSGATGSYFQKISLHEDTHKQKDQLGEEAIKRERNERDREGKELLLVVKHLHL